MSDVGATRHAAIPIGDTAAPPFARRPDPSTLFMQRSLRLRARDHQLGLYLGFLADLAAVQHGIQDGLPAVEPPAPDVLARAREHAMPPLDRGGFTPDAACEMTL